MFAYRRYRDSRYGESLLIHNELYELVIPLNFGIRILHFSTINGANVLYVQPNDMTELTTEDGWRIYGGHRIWIAPESLKTYTPDNNPIAYIMLEDGVIA